MTDTDFTLAEFCKEHRACISDIKQGDNVKLTFVLNEPVEIEQDKVVSSESMWVCVTEINRHNDSDNVSMKGFVNNDPVIVTGVVYESEICFQSCNVLQVLPS